VLLGKNRLFLQKWESCCQSGEEITLVLNQIDFAINDSVHGGETISLAVLNKKFQLDIIPAPKLIFKQHAKKVKLF